MGAMSEQLSLWPEAFPVSPSPSPAVAKATKTSVGSGPKCSESSERLDRVGSSLKTYLACALSELTGCLKTWKRKTTPRGRSWWVLTTLARPTSGSASSSWPTATAGDAKASGSRVLPGSGAHFGVSLTDATVRGMEHLLAPPGKQWPTPTVQMQEESLESWNARRERERAKGRNGNGFGVPLDMAAKMETLRTRGWATPRAEDSESAGMRHSRGEADTLTAQTRMWSTPAAQDHKNDTLPQSQATRDTLPGDVIRGLRPQDTNSSTGSRRGSSVVLNPDWVSALMGFPINWLHGIDAPGSRHSATRSSRRSRK